MKKFLLPVVGLLIGGAAAQADEVTCTYHKLQIPADVSWGPDYYYRAVEEVFEPTKHEVVDNGDGTYTLKNYQNSTYDLVFAIKDGKLSYPELTTGLRLIKDPDENNYKFHLTTIKEYPSFVAGGNIKVAAEGSLYSYVTAESNTQRVNYLELKEEKKTATEILRTYEVRVGTYFTFKVPNGEKIPGSDPVADNTSTMNVNPGAVIFDFTVSEARGGIDVAYQTASGSELFKASKCPADQDAYKTSVLEYFAGSETAISFKIDAANYADGKAPIIFTEGVSTADPDSYQPIEGAVFNLQNAAGDTNTGALAVKVSGCYATLIEGSETLQTAKYKVYIDTKFGDVTGYAVFEADGRAVAKGTPCKMTYRTYGNSPVLVEEVENMVDVIDDNTIVVYNFLNSGYNIPLTVKDKVDVSGEAYVAQSTIAVAGEYVGTDNTRTGYISVELPNGDTFTPVLNYTGGTQENASVYYNPTFTHVYYYKNGRTNYFITFGSTKYFTVEWNMGDESESGIEDVVVDENAPVEWYNLQGVRVNGENLTPGIYIKRQGSKAVKVLVR